MKERNNNKTPSTLGQTNRTLPLRPSTEDSSREQTRENDMSKVKSYSRPTWKWTHSLPQKSQLMMMICKGISYTYTPEGHQPRIQSISDYTGQCNTICYQMSVISRAQECHWQYNPSTFQGIRMQFLLSLPWMQIIIEMLQLSSDMTRLLSPGAVFSHSFVRIPPLSLSYPSNHVTIRPGALICIIQHSWDDDDPLHEYHYYCTNRGEWAAKEAHCSLL